MASLPRFSAGHILPWSFTGPHDDAVNGGTFFTLRDAAGAWIGDVRTRPLAGLLVEVINAWDDITKALQLAELAMARGDGLSYADRREAHEAVLNALAQTRVNALREKP